MAIVHAVARQEQSRGLTGPPGGDNAQGGRGVADVSVNLLEIISSVRHRACDHLSMTDHAGLDPALTEVERISMVALLRQVTPQ